MKREKMPDPRWGRGSLPVPGSDQKEKGFHFWDFIEMEKTSFSRASHTYMGEIPSGGNRKFPQGISLRCGELQEKGA